MKPDVVDEISRLVAMDKNALMEQGLAAFLRERRRRLLLEQREILSRYGVQNPGELEEMLRSGKVPDHPAWEDLITLENVEATTQALDGYLRERL